MEINPIDLLHKESESLVCGTTKLASINTGGFKTQYPFPYCFLVSHLRDAILSIDIKDNYLKGCSD